MVHDARSLGFYLETGAMGEFYAEECLLTQLCLTLCDALDCSPPGSSVHGISRQEYWNGLPFLSPGYLPDPRIKPESSVSPAL